jgi:hypothetical protein
MVKKLMVTSIAFVVLLSLAVAGIACMSVFQSSFSSKFSLQELVQRNQINNGLNCPGSGASGGIGTSGGGFGQKESSFHKGESCSCQISDADQFDEAKFIQALKESVEKDLDASKAKITSSKNPDANRFSIEYTLGDTAGRVEISGTRSAASYSLQAQLNEKNDAK